MRQIQAGRSLRLGLISIFLLAMASLAACGGGGGSSTGANDPPPSGGGGGGGGTTPTLPTSTSSSETAYARATASGWQIVPLITVGDTPPSSSYRMAGKPDGLGALAGRLSATGQLSNAGTELTVLMNHELPPFAGTARAHGTRGAYVSHWTFDLDTLRVTEGRDLVTRVMGWRGGTWAETTGTDVFDRLCSADLPPASAFYNSGSGRGYDGRLFLTGEEIDEGRGYAMVVGGAEHGTAYELPYLGKYAHENVVAHPSSGDVTIAVSLDDVAPGQVYVYVGMKQNSGNPVERAGLHGGKLYGIRVANGGSNYANGPVTRETRGAIEGTFELVDVTDVALGTGAALQSASTNRGVTEFARPEDGAWDVRNARAFYFATTGMNFGGTDHPARLYRLVFDSLQNPTGGAIELVLDSTSLTASDGDRGYGFDNVTVDGAGRVIVDEDGGDRAHVSKVWVHDPSTSATTQVLEADRNRFLDGGSSFLTRNEEHSGVIEVTDVVRNARWYESGRRYYLGTMQAHYPHPDTSLFEGGQLYLFASPR